MSKPIDTVSLLEYLGLPKEIDTFDKFKEEVDKKYITKDNATKDPDVINAVIGKRMNVIQNAITAAADKIGITYDVKEVKDKKVEEVVEILFTKQKDAAGNEIQTLKKQAESSVDDRIKALTQEKEKTKKDYDELLGLHNNLKDEHTRYKDGVALEKKNTFINSRKTKALSGLALSPTMKELEKEGLLSRLNNKYKYDWDETAGDTIVMNEKGERIKSEKKAGEFMSIDELYEKEAASADLLIKNPNAGNKTGIKQEEKKVEPPANNNPERRLSSKVTGEEN